MYLQGKISGDPGIWRSTDEGANWEKIATYPLGIYDRINAIDGDKDVFGKVYMGFGGSGFTYGEANGQTQQPTATSAPTNQTTATTAPTNAPTTTATAPAATTTATAAPSGQTIANLTLYNAATDQPIGDLKDGATLDLKQIGTNQLSVVATTNPATVGSVTFALDGQVIQTENYVPYSITGDAPKQGGRNYQPWTPTVGEHTLIVTPYNQAKGQGQAGTPMTVRFTVR
jgi:hypothetical protein